jgi:hypothetical protein
MSGVFESRFDTQGRARSPLPSGFFATGMEHLWNAAIVQHFAP